MQRGDNRLDRHGTEMLLAHVFEHMLLTVVEKTHYAATIEVELDNAEEARAELAGDAKGALERAEDLQQRLQQLEEESGQAAVSHAAAVEQLERLHRDELGRQRGRIAELEQKLAEALADGQDRARVLEERCRQVEQQAERIRELEAQVALEARKVAG